MLPVNAHSLQLLLEGVRSDFADQLIRHPMAFTGTIHSTFNVLFAAIPQLPQSLLVVTAVRMKQSGCTHCASSDETAGSWRMQAQVWGWGAYSEGCCATALELLSRRVLQCQLEHLQQSYEAALAREESLPTPPCEVNKWLRQEQPEVALVNLQAICAPDVFLSLFFRALGDFSFVALHREETEATGVFPQTQGSRCGRREGAEVVRLGSFVEFVMVSGETQEVSLARVSLQQGSSKITALRSGGHCVEESCRESEGNGIENGVESQRSEKSLQEDLQRNPSDHSQCNQQHDRSNQPINHPTDTYNHPHDQPADQPVEQFNQPVDQYNQHIDHHNQHIDQHNQHIDQHNHHTPHTPTSLLERLLAHIPRSLDGAMTQTPHAGLYMELTVWTAPLSLTDPSSSPRDTARTLRHTIVALAKQARIEWAFHGGVTQSICGLSRVVTSPADFRHVAGGQNGADFGQILPFGVVVQSQ